MGMAKGHMLEIQERGYDDPPDTFVCFNCIGDYALSNYIKHNASHKKCSYCSKSYSKNCTISLKNLIDYIMECIRTEWNIAVDAGVPWDSREGGWLLPTVDTWDLLDNSEPIDATDDLREDILSSVHSDQWINEREGYNDDDVVQDEWESFTLAIKHKIRFIGFTEPLHDTLFNNRRYRNGMPINPFKYILSAINDFGMVTTLDTNTNILRARQSGEKRNYNAASHMGTAPAKKAAQANRMSPIGIPMFYGTFDKQTAAAEIRYDGNNFLHLGHFVPSRPINLIDFTKSPKIPSIYENNKQRRSMAKFIRGFSKDISKPLNKDISEHLDYIPTQVITEYLRYNFKIKGQSIDGLLFKSSYTGEKSCVLFVENEHCSDSLDNTERHKLLLVLKKYKMFNPIN